MVLSKGKTDVPNWRRRGSGVWRSRDPLANTVDHEEIWYEPNVYQSNQTPMLNFHLTRNATRVNPSKTFGHYSHLRGSLFLFVQFNLYYQNTRLTVQSKRSPDLPFSNLVVPVHPSTYLEPLTSQTPRDTSRIVVVITFSRVRLSHWWVGWSRLRQ